jgi:lipopolysaccharide assembly protein A
MMKVRLIVATVLAVLLITFTLQNAEVVELRFLVWTLSLSRALLIFSVIVMGMVLGWILRMKR